MSNWVYGQRPATFGENTVPNTIVYKLKPAAAQAARTNQASARSFNRALEHIGAQRVHQKFPAQAAAPATNTRKRTPTVDLSLIYELQYAPGMKLEEVQQTLMATGLVAYAEPLYIREPLSQPNDPHADSLKTNQFYLKLVRAYEGWAVEKGDTNVVIGILDTGYKLSHEDLRTKVKRNYSDPIDGIDNDGDGYVDNYTGWDFSDQDNNVFDDTQYKGHGTGVAGVAAGATNNGKGIASLGYNTLFMPLKVFSSVKNGRFGGYEAIVYAATHGCKVINLSWGGTGQSQFEQDIINFAALDYDVLIVAAAGNTNKLLDIFPAAYDNVLSVGGSNTLDVKSRDHSYNYRIDLTAPSENILSPNMTSDNSYAGAWGTSFASPIVAGAAALVRSRFPHLTALQAIERLRVSTDDIYSLTGNQPYVGLLGKGRLNLKRALKEAQLRSVRCTLAKLEARSPVAAAGSTVFLEASFQNYLAPVSNLTVSLSTASPYVQVEQGTFIAGVMATNSTSHTGARPYTLRITADAPENYTVYLRLDFSDDSYTDFQYIPLVINPSIVTLTANNINISLNNTGNLGYNGLNFKQGVGMQYKGGPSLLFEGGLIVATDSTRVSDNLHNADWLNDNNYKSAGPIQLYNSTALADQEVRSAMTAAGEGKAGVKVKQVASAWKSSPDLDYVIVEYQLTNITPDTLRKVHAGLFADWDIGNYTQNAAAWDSALALGYVYNTVAPLPYAGLKLLSDTGAPLYHAADNVGGNDSTVTVDDGFTDLEKYKIISRGISRTRAGGVNGNSVSHVLGETFYQLAPNETRTVAFAVLAADNLDDMRTSAAAAQAKYKSIKTGPLPSGVQQSICKGAAVLVTPDKGSNFRFYTDQPKQHLIGEGNSLNLGTLVDNKTIYVSNADSLFESATVAYTYQVAALPVANFTLEKAYATTAAAISPVNHSEHAASLLWDFGDGTVSTDLQPQHTYQNAGLYSITLTATDSMGCTQSITQKQVQVYANEIVLYPNPAYNFVALSLLGPIDPHNKASTPHLTLTDLTGKVVSPDSSIQGSNLHFDVSRLTAGIYIAHVRYNNTTITKRILVRHR
ncbi:S8 family serine peptidase [Pontibacter sp. CAU 1760]